VAEMPANTELACPPQLESIKTVKVFFVYIPTKEITETIRGPCLNEGIHPLIEKNQLKL
jgi:hypothetical protein